MIERMDEKYGQKIAWKRLISSISNRKPHLQLRGRSKITSHNLVTKVPKTLDILLTECNTDVFLQCDGCDVKSNSQSISMKIQVSGEVEVEPDIATFVVTASCVNKKINISNT